MGDLLGCCSEFAMRVVRDFSLGEIERVETGMVGDLRVWDLHEGTYTCPPRSPPPLLPLLSLAPRSLLSLAPPPLHFKPQPQRGCIHGARPYRHLQRSPKEKVTGPLTLLREGQRQVAADALRATESPIFCLNVLTGSSQVGTLSVWYKFVNFGVEKYPSSSN